MISDALNVLRMNGFPLMIPDPLNMVGIECKSLIQIKDCAADRADVCSFVHPLDVRLRPLSIHCLGSGLVFGGGLVVDGGAVGGDRGDAQSADEAPRAVPAQLVLRSARGTRRRV